MDEALKSLPVVLWERRGEGRVEVEVIVSCGEVFEIITVVDFLP